MKDLLGVSPSKGNPQGTARGKEKFLLTSLSDLVAQSVEYPEVVGSIPTEVKRNFSLPHVVP